MTVVPEPSPDSGRRLLPSLIDEIAQSSPEAPFVAISRSLDVHNGFRDVSYRELARAINKFSWWIERNIGKSQTFETLGYLGPLDLRYPLLILAAVKTGHKV